jgi:hypothetical protein
LSQLFFNLEKELSPQPTTLSVGLACPFFPNNEKKSREMWRDREIWLGEYQFLKNLKQWTHFRKTFWKMSKVESKVVGNCDVEKGKC